VARTLGRLRLEKVNLIAKQKPGKPKEAKGKMAESLLDIIEVDGTDTDVANPHRDTKETVPQLPQQGAK
jgi:hypothetical protein